MPNINPLTNHFLMKKIFFIALLGALLGVAISYFILYSELQEAFKYSFFDGLLASLLGTIVALIIAKSSLFLNRFFPWHKNVGIRLFIGLVVHFTLAYFLVFSVFYCYQLFFFEVTSFFNRYFYAQIKIGVILLLLILIFEVIYFALFSYYSYSKFQIEIVKQERKQIELQLKALKSQLSPHFLFNCLNTISSLIYKDENSAEKFIRRLAKMYDFTLKSYHQKLITVQQELDFVNSYIFLLQTRFKNKFSVVISVSDAVLLTKIPPLTLQMLVENAVKHNQLLQEKPLEILISSTKTAIIVENVITKTPLNVTSFNIGLNNINSRYLLLINKTISVVSGHTFRVQIPIIE